MKIKIKLILCIIASSSLGQANPGIDMSKLAETLRLEGTELKIEDATKREADARKLPLRSAWIVSEHSKRQAFYQEFPCHVDIIRLSTAAMSVNNRKR